MATLQALLCTACGYTGEPRSVTKGSMSIEIILWLCLIIPGLIYSIWRLSSRYEACPYCGNENIIPIFSPVAQKFIRENLPECAAIATADYSPPSAAAMMAGQGFGRFVGRFLRTIKKLLRK